MKIYIYKHKNNELKEKNSTYKADFQAPDQQIYYLEM